MWQAASAPAISTFSQMASWSQSVRISTTRWRVAALLALAPELAARARPVMRLAGLDGAGERLGVHIGEHQHLAGRGRGGDDGNRPSASKRGAKTVPSSISVLLSGAGKGAGLLTAMMSFAGARVSRGRARSRAS